MRITELQATNLELTSAIREYVTEKVESLSRFTKRFDPCDVAVEIGKTSEHHQKGDVFFAELTMSIPGDTLRSHVEKDDLYAAVDEAKDDVKRQLVDKKEKMMDARSEGADEGIEEDIVDEDDEEEEENDATVANEREE